MKEKLRYKNEEDKCYGATGMAMALVIYDGEDILSAVDLDAEPGSMVEFTDEFYFNGNPGFSAKNAWNQILKNFNLAMATSIGNVLCRHVIFENHDVDDDVKSFLRDLMISEGSDNCQLEEDESRHLFEKNFQYLDRVFHHNGVRTVAHEFARVLNSRRRLTRMDVLDQLRALSLI
ncbi:MAG: hypothetical protein NC111_06940 [Bacteroides sp.]|nr:hypothetical protein [Bacteroides sp.]MCM1413739.1 hypothetical protein [Bacteroides sp.]MCM1472242.1 hypothetical protein [Bacteroides sp.]